MEKQPAGEMPKIEVNGFDTASTKLLVCSALARRKPFRFDEFDFAGKVWSVPRERMKGPHMPKSKLAKAYLRADLLEKRRRLMEAWARFCEPQAPAHKTARRRTKLKTANGRPRKGSNHDQSLHTVRQMLHQH